MARFKFAFDGEMHKLSSRAVKVTISRACVCVCLCSFRGPDMLFFFFSFFFFSFFFLKGTGVVSYLNVLAITAGSFLFKETAMFIRCLCCSVSSTSDMFEAI